MRAQKRGWPLLSLALILGGWIMLRSAMWEPLGVVLNEPATEPTPRMAELSEPMTSRVSDNQSPSVLPSMVATGAETTFPSSGPRWQGRPASPLPRQDTFDPEPVAVPVPGVPAMPAFRQRNDPAAPPVTRPRTRSSNLPVALAAPPGPRRLGLDSWMLWRDDTQTSITSGRPSYGRSQAGVVLRYRIDPGSRHQPQAYTRLTRALAGAAETELAAGVSARPVPALPLTLAAEGRVFDGAAGREVRGAVLAIVQPPLLPLPGGLEGDAYLQAGYVSGDFATPFADGQARITRPVTVDREVRAYAGAGAWGGAQDDGQRLDIGPTIGLEVPLGPVRTRMSLDYRFRIAGNAQPESGPALTLTAGF